MANDTNPFIVPQAEIFQFGDESGKLWRLNCVPIRLKPYAGIIAEQANKE